MTPAQLAEALRRLVPLKTHRATAAEPCLPRARRPSLRRAAREARRRLSLAIADFEQALATQDGARGLTGAVLDQLCERYTAEDERQGGPDEGEPEASAGRTSARTPGPAGTPRESMSTPYEILDLPHGRPT
jgi:hypothetical protein